MKDSKILKKLNIGCGNTKLPGFVNLDINPSADVVFDLESCGQDVPCNTSFSHFPAQNPGTYKARMPFEDNTFDRMLMSHTFEHITRILPLMEELWRIAKPGCSLVIITPYGSSDNADEDPTHVRRVFKDTFFYFSQAWYGQADYGYRGDWDYRLRQFKVDASLFDNSVTEEQIGLAVGQMRNVVLEFLVELVAVKPARAPGTKLEREVTTSFKLANTEAVRRILVAGGQ